MRADTTHQNAHTTAARYGRIGSPCCRWRLLAGAALLGLCAAAGAQTATEADSNGPIRLRPPATAPATTLPGVNPLTGKSAESDKDSLARQQYEEERERRRELNPALDPAVPNGRFGEFELYVRKMVGAYDLRRFGADLLPALSAAAEKDSALSTPPDYVVGAGDEIIVMLWGSIDAELRLTVDRNGRINIPRVGAITVAGTKQADLREVIRQRTAQVFRNFDLSASVGQLRGMKVYVTGFAEKPGAYLVSSVATALDVLLRAGGPSVSGSLRSIELKRAGKVVSKIDIYDMLLRGDRSTDQSLQTGDIIHVNALGPQIAVIGSVTKQAVYESLPGESIGDALRMAGGFSATADRSRVSIERLADRLGARFTEYQIAAALDQKLSPGDILRAFSAVDTVASTETQSKRIRIEGEVRSPGTYLLPARATTDDVIAAAGGYTNAAYVFATEFTRESVRLTQQQNYDRALTDLETEFTKAATTQKATSADEAATLQARSQATTKLIERLRTMRPTGRIVLPLAVDARGIPSLPLEDGDRIYIPARTSAVGVFGSVFHGGSYLYTSNKRIGDYLRLAGGPTKGADTSSVFIIRADGSVISARQQGGGGWLLPRDNWSELQAQAGDTVIVPEEINKTSFIQNAKDWALIFSQFGLGVAAIRTLTQ